MGRIALVVMYRMYLLARFIIGGAGAQYRVGWLTRLRLAIRIIWNSQRIRSLTEWQEHLVIVEEILRIDPLLRGDVVECGCYEGASTAGLSLACALTNRKLIVCDSFKGLPPPRENEVYDIRPDSVDFYKWEEGEFSPKGGLDKVRRNVEDFGNIEACEFVAGYFSDTLRDLDTTAIVLVFEDVDMRSSVEDCLRYLWPKLQDGCKWYCHEPWSVNVVSVFYDREWWKANVGVDPPGFFGSGHGMLGTGGEILPCFGLGYTMKFDPNKIRERGRKIIHLGSKGYSDEY